MISAIAILATLSLKFDAITGNCGGMITLGSLHQSQQVIHIEKKGERTYYQGTREGIIKKKQRFPMMMQKVLAKVTILVMVLSVFGIFGCATMSDKFTSGKKADLGFFADHTIAMLSDVNVSVKRDDTIHSRRYFNYNEAEEKRVVFLQDNMEASLEDIVNYSITIVNIMESDHPTEEKIKRYANFLSEFKEGILYGTKLTSDQFDSTIKDIGQQTEVLAAFRFAQPMIDAAVISSIMELNDLTDAIDLLANKLDGKIDEEYAEVIRYQKILEHEKGQLLKAFEIIYEAYRTDEPDLKKLTESGVIWIPEIIPEVRPTKKDLHAIGEHLYARSKALSVVQTELQPFWDEYRAAHKEIDDLADQAMEQIAKVRLILLVWTRAHQKMASGTVDPADWFDINDAPAMLIQLGLKAI
jgi:hypothetical protein